MKGRIYLLFCTSCLAQEAGTTAKKKKKDYHASLINSLHIFTSSTTCMSQFSFCCYLCQTHSVLRMWKINLGQDTTMLDSLQTNKGNWLERRPRSIQAIRTLPLATLQTKINPPLLFLSGKYTQTFPSGQAPPEGGTSGSQQQIYARTSAEHWPAFIMDHSSTLQCRLTITSKLWFFPTPLG